MVNRQIATAGATALETGWWSGVEWLDNVLDEVVGNVEYAQLLQRGNRNVGDFGENVVGEKELRIIII